jgi:hypothetical protein
MAVIPLKDIPNIGDLASMSRPQTNDVNVPKVDFSGEKASVAAGYASVIRSNRAANEDVRTAGLVGAQIAEAGQGVYKAAKTLADKQQELNDNAAWAEFSTNYSLQKADFEDSLSQSNPATWTSSYANFRAKNVDPAWQALPVSVQQKRYGEYLNLTSQDQVKISHAAFQKNIADSTAKSLTDINLSLENHQYDQAESKASELFAINAISAKEHESILSKAASGKQISGLYSQAAQDPSGVSAFAMARRVEEAINTDTPLEGADKIPRSMYPGMKDNFEKLGTVRQQKLVWEMTMDDSLKTPEDVVKDPRFSSIRDEKDKESLKNRVVNSRLTTPVTQAADSELMGMLDRFPQDRNNAGQEAIEIQRRIMNEASGPMASHLLKSLDDIRQDMADHGGNRKMESELKKYASERLHAMTIGGMFGEYPQSPSDAFNPVWANKKIQALGREADLMQKIMAESPKTRQDIDELIGKTVTPVEALRGGASLIGKPPEKPSWLNHPIDRWNYKPPQASNDAGDSAGKITSYGYEGDPYGGPKAKATKTGAFNDNELTNKSLAVSPDVQARFKEAGINPLEPVELTLEDGTKVVRNYDDHTASDQEARKLGLKPLRGRFDFRSVDGKQEKDGMRVVSFRKYTEDGRG